MPVELEKGFETGWRKRKPTDPIFCIYFVNSKTDDLIFTYGAKLTDRKFFMEYFDELEKYDREKLQKRKEKICTEKSL